MKRIIAAGVTALVFAGTGAAACESADVEVQEPPEGTAEYTAIENGTFLVGEDLRPGNWKVSGAGPLCYWERVRDLEGNVDSILDNGLGEGSHIVTILPTDHAFTTRDCGAWGRIGE